MTPPALHRTALEKDCGSYSRSIMDGIFFQIENVSAAGPWHSVLFNSKTRFRNNMLQLKLNQQLET